MKNNQNLVSFSPEKGVYLYFADSKMILLISMLSLEFEVSFCPDLTQIEID